MAFLVFVTGGQLDCTPALPDLQAAFCWCDGAVPAKIFPAMIPESKAPLIPRRLLFGNPSNAQPTVSGDGKLLAYLAPDAFGVLNVHVRKIGLHNNRQLTKDAGRGIHYYQWQQDSRHILYLQDADGDENHHVYQASLETGIIRDLTPYAQVKADFISLNPDHPNEMVVGLNLRDRSVFDVYRVNLSTQATSLDTKNPGDVIRWTCDHQFQVRGALASRPDGGREARIRDDSASPWKTVYEWGPDETLGTIFAFNSAGSGLLVSSSVGANASRLMEISSTGAAHVVAADAMYDIAGVLMHPTKHHVQAVAFLRAHQDWLVLDDSVRPDFEFLEGKHSGEVFILSRDHSDRIWAVEFLSDDSCAEFYLYDRQQATLMYLFSDFPELKNYPLNKVRAVEFSAHDKMRLFSFLCLPKVRNAGNLPLVLLVHGGPWARDVQRFSPEVQRLANRGYAVLQVNFRGSSGYGKEYLNAGDREWGKKMQSDLIDAKNWAVREGFADTKRVALYGFSYGGYAALAGLAFTPNEFCCGIAAMAPSNLLTFLASIPPYWGPQQALFFKRLGHPVQDKEYLKAVSPLFHVDSIVSPLLLCHGANDPRVKQSESDQLVRSLRTRGKEVEYLVFADEGHGFYKPQNRLKFFAAVEMFLARHLGGGVEPVSETEKWDAVLWNSE